MSERISTHQAEEAALSLLRQNKIEQAIKLAEDWEASKGFPKDPLFGGINSAALLEAMTVRAECLAGLADQVLGVIREAACLAFLFGRNPTQTQLRGLETGIRYDAISSLRLLIAAAHHSAERKSWLAENIVTSVSILCANGASQFEGVCPTCRELHGHEWTLEKAPELPLTICTSPTGCRCSWSPKVVG